MNMTKDTKKEDVKKVKDKSKSPSMQELMTKKENLKQATSFPMAGQIVEGKVIALAKNEIYVDISGIATGVVRGPELYDESGEFSDLKVGGSITATVINLNNEKGEIELSFRSAGHQKAWDKLTEHLKRGDIVSVKVIDANKGGLMLRLGQVDFSGSISPLSRTI